MEVFLNDDGAAFATQIQETLPISTTRTRQILAELSEDGLVTVRKKSDVNIYSLSDEGYDRAVSFMRETVD